MPFNRRPHSHTPTHSRQRDSDASSPQCTSLGCGRKISVPGRTHTEMGRMYKLHTDRGPSQGLIFHPPYSSTCCRTFLNAAQFTNPWIKPVRHTYLNFWRHTYYDQKWKSSYVFLIIYCIKLAVQKSQKDVENRFQIIKYYWTYIQRFHSGCEFSLLRFFKPWSSSSKLGLIKLWNGIHLLLSVFCVRVIILLKRVYSKKEKNLGVNARNNGTITSDIYNLKSCVWKISTLG